MPADFYSNSFLKKKKYQVSLTDVYVSSPLESLILHLNLDYSPNKLNNMQ